MTNKMFTVTEAAIFADILDMIGDFKNANLLDEYIKSYGNIEKQAGIWERVKGWTKTKLFKEYKELHDKAVAAQDLIEKKMEEINNQYKDLRADLKNYRLNEWQYKVRQLNRKVERLDEAMADFDKSYAAYLQNVIGIQEMVKEQEEEKAMQEKSIPELMEGISQWKPVNRRNKFVQIHSSGDQIRIHRSRMKGLITHTYRLEDKTGQDRFLIKLNREAIGNVPEELSYALKGDVWQFVMHDPEYIYLMKTDLSESEAKKRGEEVPPEQAMENVKFVEPKLPKVEESGAAVEPATESAPVPTEVKETDKPKRGRGRPKKEVKAELVKILSQSRVDRLIKILNS